MRNCKIIAMVTIIAVLFTAALFAGGKTDSAKKDEVKLTYVYWGSPAEDAAVKAALKEFMEANPGIKVEGMYLLVILTVQVIMQK